MRPLVTAATAAAVLIGTQHWPFDLSFRDGEPPTALLGGTAWAAPTARTIEDAYDIDGDGREDRVTLAAGRLSVALSSGPRTEEEISPGLSATLVGGDLQFARGPGVGPGTAILAIAEFAEGDRARRSHAIALYWSGGAFRTLWRGSVGRQGADGEYAVEVELTPNGLIRYQSRADIARCDGVTPHLFAERYHFGKGKFAAVGELVRIHGDATELVARRTATAAMQRLTAPHVFRAVASSSQRGARSARELTAPKEIDDGDPESAWIEGKAGAGGGEFVTFASDLGDERVRYLRIIPGHARDRTTFAGHNRLRRVGLIVGEQHYWLRFQPDPLRGAYRDAYWVEIPNAPRTSCVSLVLADIYAASGAGAGATAIAEVALFSELELADGGAEAALTELVVAGGARGRRAARLLATAGAAAETAVVSALARPDLSAASARRLRLVLADIPAGADELVRGLTAARVSAADRRQFSEGLRKLGDRAVPALARAIADRNRPERVRMRVAGLLGSIPGDDGVTALLAVTGEGGRKLRATVSRALGAAAPAQLPRLLEAAAAASATPPREADLWRAVGTLARRANEEPATAAAEAMAARLVRVEEYELRYRLTAALAGLPHRPAIAAIVTVFSSAQRKGDRGAVEEVARAAAIRRVAVRALKQNRAESTLDPLVIATSDPDPGVRKAAAAALGARFQANPRGDTALMARLEQDRWPEVRGAAAAALAPRCKRRPAAAALFRTFKNDRSIDVRRAAITSLVSCRARGIGPKLLAVAADRAEVYLLRTHSLRQLGVLGVRKHAGRILAILPALLKEASRVEPAERLAATAIWTLGRLQHKPAVTPLRRIAQESKISPTVRAAAVMALAEFCNPKNRALLKKLERSSERAVSLAAARARAECR